MTMITLENDEKIEYLKEVEEAALKRKKLLIQKLVFQSLNQILY